MKFALIFMLVIGTALAVDLYNDDVKDLNTDSCGSFEERDEKKASGEMKNFETFLDRFKKNMRDARDKLKSKLEEQKQMIEETGRRYGMIMKEKLQQLNEKVNHALEEAHRHGAEMKEGIKQKLEELQKQIEQQIREFSEKKDAFSQKVEAALKEKLQEIRESIKQLKIQSEAKIEGQTESQTLAIQTEPETTVQPDTTV